jgi:HPt (histidine-containing phosphotransfer) domain-containing protein
LEAPGTDEPPRAAEPPIEGGAFTATAGRAVAPRFDADPARVLDEGQMAKLIGLMGPDWVFKSLGKFATDVEARLAALDAADPSELASIAHGMIGMSAHCGFMELFHVCEEVQREARRGAGSDRVGELRAAGARALAVMRSYSPRA